MFLDIFVLFILAVSTLIAFMRGFIREALTLVTITVALTASYMGAPHLEPLMNTWLGVTEGADPEKLLGIIPMPIVSTLLSYGSIFILLIIIFSIASHFIAEFIKSLGLGAVDRSLGALFGLIRGIVMLAILYMPLHFLLDEQVKKDWFAKSKSHVYLEKSAVFMAGLLPDDFIEDTAQDAQEFSQDHPQEIKSAREKLQALDLLQNNISSDDLNTLKKSLDDNAAIDSDSNEGYSDEFREKLDMLFEENNTGTSPNNNE